MANRTCAECSKDKSIEGGRICEKGHFICKQCVWRESGLLVEREKTRCPVDRTRLT